MDTIEIEPDELAEQPCPIGWMFSNATNIVYFSHIWHPVGDNQARRCVVLREDNKKYYASSARWYNDDKDIGPYDTLAEACAVADFLIR